MDNIFINKFKNSDFFNIENNNSSVIQIKNSQKKDLI